ncbi:MAG: methyl-accepting chemotaxis protein [Candidatus Pelagadaptatus aseana]|uniref:methyl-accepting chemotaxis protein n=1 Tax=Candidatus Pelagadaptatus aseana TaxID=3120508 RepID=UPI0039B2F911
MASWYRAIERLFFNSLSKKITGNVVFLLLPHIALLLIGYHYAGEISVVIESLQLTEIQQQQLNTLLDDFWSLGAATLLVALLAGVFTIFFMRHLFLQPVVAMTEVLSNIKTKNGDISATLPAYTCDEISDMACSYNEFAESLKQMIAEMRRRSVNVALCATRLQKTLAGVDESVREQQQRADRVYRSSEEATLAINNIALSATTIRETNDATQAEVKLSRQDLDKVLHQVSDVGELALNFQETVRQLSNNSDNISKILTMVQDFSEQTNLLALNASIEAARAGEAGRGFAVVADEVRGLAQKVSSATTEIDKNIAQMSALVDETRSSADSIQSHVSKTVDHVDTANTRFDKLVTDFQVVGEQLSGIGAAIDQLAETNQGSHQSVIDISNIARQIAEEMDGSRTYSEDLEVSTEQSQELLSQFIIGFGGFENMIQIVRGWAVQTTEQLEVLSASQNLFDQDYIRANEGQLPEKYNVGYVDAFASAMQPLFESFIKQHPQFIYAIAVDKNGYAPVHHAKVSQPMTGNFEVDNLNSRHRRIFNGSRAEIRRAASTAPFLLQTFIRDTGQVLNDLSIPLYVNGKHWGALITGFEPQQLLEDDR